MPLRLFASPERAGAYAGRVLFLGAMMGFWFSPRSTHRAGIALPMILVGAGQGASLSPLNGAGIAGVAAADAGAASGLVNVAHQLGGSVGLGILVTVFAAATSGPSAPRAMLAHQVGASLTAGSAMLALALVLVVVLILRPALARPSAKGTCQQPH